jgi:hypothetical protein
MAPIQVVVAYTASDIKAEVIENSVAARPDMILVANRAVAAVEVERLLETIVEPAAVFIVGSPGDTADMARQWLAEHANLLVVHVDIVGDRVRFGLRNPRLDAVLNAVRELLRDVAPAEAREIKQIYVPAMEAPKADGRGASQGGPGRPLLQAAVQLVHTLLREAVSLSPENGDMHGLSVTRATLLQSLDKASVPEAAEAHGAVDAALETLDGNTEPLAVAARVLGLRPLEFKVMALALAPELDIRYQLCIGFLLEEMGRRVGALALYSSLLGDALSVRSELSRSGALARWRVFEGNAGHLPTGDEPLRVDPFLAQWLLDEGTALGADPRVRRILRLSPWAGADILHEAGEHASAGKLLDQLSSAAPRWLLLRDDDHSAWRALLELGTRDRNLTPSRVEAARLKSTDSSEIEECAVRIARMVRLTGNPLIVDLSDDSETDDDTLRLFLTTVHSAGCAGALIGANDTRAARLLGAIDYERAPEPALSTGARVAAIGAAAKHAEVYLTEQSAETIANRFPLQVDNLEHAMRLARNRPKNYDEHDPELARLLEAYKELASAGISHFAERIEPVFSLDQVILPPERKEQLVEIADHVRLAPRVLDGWRFRDQLPYGRGVTALFHGQSGTGKTMAAMGIARSLGVQLLRLDLSRVVSKYIGETEKHIDRVFSDAQRSGSALLIDEADALLGKRSEVKDAHDRYANIEVAYLLLRMEAFEGLAILTTNMRQNLDPALLRRLRFILEFPRPDAGAREQIWRQCLPEASHDLDDAAFRQLARRIDLTGGHIRQITLRAAFLAAAEDAQIGLRHIASAARAEFAKLGMPPVELDFNRERHAA